MYEVICVESRTPEWLAARQSGLGSSDISSVLGLNPWKSAYALWAEKAGLLPVEDISDRDSVVWGNKLERSVIEEYERRTKRESKPNSSLYRSVEFPWALATPDAWTRRDGDCAVLEIKTTGERHGEKWVEGPPPHVNAQVQHQMFVADAPAASVAVLIGGQRFVWMDVDRDDALIEQIRVKRAEFWERVLEKKPPTADGSKSTIAALSELYRQDDGESCALPASYVELFDELEQLRATMRGFSERCTEIEALVKAELGLRTKGLLPDGRYVTWKTVKRKGYQVGESERRELRFSREK